MSGSSEMALAERIGTGRGVRKKKKKKRNRDREVGIPRKEDEWKAMGFPPGHSFKLGNLGHRQLVPVGAGGRSG